MIKKAFQFGALGILLSGPALAMPPGSQLREAHLAATASAAQLTLEVSGDPTRQRLFTLDHPRRVVIDLLHTRRASGFRLPAASGLVTDLRTGARPGGTLRLVVQLTSAVSTHSVWISPRGGRRELLINFGHTSAMAELNPDAARSLRERGAVPELAGATAPAEPRIVRALHAPTDSDRDVIIAVDAGHGGQDPGATGPRGTHEKDVVLTIARALAARINAEPGMRAVLTRNRDEFLVLRDRIRRARLARADMFISVHADSIANREISGASVYVLSERGASSETARWLAERQNAADLMGGVSLEDKDETLKSVLLDLSQSANISASMSAAQRVLAALDGVGQVRKSQVQQAGFVVLKSPDIPSMLVETAYISNPSEELRLRNAREQSSLAEAIFTGVRSYFEQNPPVGTRFAQARRSTVASLMAAPPPN